MVIGIYYIHQGFFIEVLTILASIFFTTGMLLVIAYVISKELFLWLIGKRSEYNKVLNASQKLSIGLSRLAIDAIPIGLDKEEKKRLKEDVPVFVEMRFTQSINDFIMRIFIGAFATAFGLLGTIVLMKQNEKIDLQNSLVREQNKKVNIQNNLMEAERRSSLIFLMSNILDKMDNEIREEVKIKGDSTRYTLSKPLISRIVALSKAFKPYKLLDNDTLSNKLVSPERGQLLIALMGSSLDSTTQNTITRQGDFSNAIASNINLQFAGLFEANFSGADFSSANLSNTTLILADLSGSNLNGANFIGANLFNSDCSDAKLNSADLSGAFLMGADFSSANFKNIKHATAAKLEQVKSLYQAKNLPAKIESQLRKERPCLFTEKGCK